MLCVMLFCVLFFVKQNTAYEMRMSDWSSDVCSSDLIEILTANQRLEQSEADCGKLQRELDDTAADRNRLSFEQGFLERQLSDLKSERSVLEIGRASCRERVCQYV